MELTVEELCDAALSEKWIKHWTLKHNAHGFTLTIKISSALYTFRNTDYDELQKVVEQFLIVFETDEEACTFH